MANSDNLYGKNADGTEYQHTIGGTTPTVTAQGKIVA